MTSCMTLVRAALTKTLRKRLQIRPIFEWFRLIDTVGVPHAILGSAEPGHSKFIGLYRLDRGIHR